MRRILMSKPGEFNFKRTHFIRGMAIRMLADIIGKSEEKDDTKEEVVAVSRDGRLLVQKKRER